MMEKLQKSSLGRTLLVVIGTVITTLGVYFFKFPNHFSFGGVTGIAVIIGKITPWSPGTVTLVLNILLLGIGFLFLGKDFGAKTILSSLLMSGGLWVLEQVYPMESPLTDQKVLEFALAVFLPSVGAAILFNIGASGGGTDILAMIIRQRTGFNAGSALLAVDVVITVAAFLVFDIQSGLFALTGLMAKTFAINGSIESLNLCKYFNIICDRPEPICRFINKQLHRGATVCSARGAFSQDDKFIIFTVLGRSQAIQLRNFVKQTDSHAFITISNSSEIIGRGFQD